MTPAFPGDPVHPTYEALGGFLRTAARENRRLTYRTVDVGADGVRAWLSGAGSTADRIAAELADRWDGDHEVRYRGDVRSVKRWRETAPADGVTPVRKGGVYVVSGGAGGLGLLLARELAGEFGARLILAGRRAPDARIEDVLDELRALGGAASYVQADVSQEYGATAVVQAAKSEFGAVHGVFHCAGILRDDFLVNQSLFDIESVQQHVS